MEKIDKGFIITSEAFSLKSNKIKYYLKSDKSPATGDIVYGKISHIGQHFNLENKSGRIHEIHSGIKEIFVFGNRYTRDYFEAFIPTQFTNKIDLVARGGLIAEVCTKNSDIKNTLRSKMILLCETSMNSLFQGELK